jgi:hypothetical protein
MILVVVWLSIKRQPTYVKSLDSVSELKAFAPGVQAKTKNISNEIKGASKVQSRAAHPCQWRRQASMPSS